MWIERVDSHLGRVGGHGGVGQKLPLSLPLLLMLLLFRDDVQLSVTWSAPRRDGRAPWERGGGW